MIRKTAWRSPDGVSAIYVVLSAMAEDLVRVTGLEPARLSAQEPKSCVSASFTTPAYDAGRCRL